MSPREFSYVYGPVPSRRLGKSLGLDLVPYKICSCDCIYCQLGRTTEKTVDRREHVPVAAVLAEVKRKLAGGPAPDYISLAGSGEPTLHGGIGEIISGIKKMTTLPVAVITNGSLLWMEDVRKDLREADVVLPSLDAGDERMFRLINRPHPAVRFDAFVEGLSAFCRDFPGKVRLEVMLVVGKTDVFEEAEKIAGIVEGLRTSSVDLNTVSRPPADPDARAVSLHRMAALKGLFPRNASVICDFGAGDSGSATRDSRAGGEILSLLRRRPCTLADVARGLEINPNEAAKILTHLARTGEIRERRIGDRLYYSAEETGKADEGR